MAYCYSCYSSSFYNQEWGVQMGQRQPAIKIVQEEAEESQPAPVQAGAPPEIPLVGRIKVRVIAMALLLPWWFEWPFNEERRPLVVLLVVLLTLVPLVHKILQGNNARRAEKLIDGILGLLIALVVQTSILTTAALSLALVASPEDSIFMVPVTIFFRVVSAPIFSAVALFSSSFKELRWYQVGMRSFEIGARAGYDLARHTYRNSIGSWLEHYGKCLYQLIRKS